MTIVNQLLKVVMMLKMIMTMTIKKKANVVNNMVTQGLNITQIYFKIW